ncbi:MAG: phospho-sugar mutase, partial [Myxococcota bacterium]|nr:phospho-sugar mutase [Myxococcota bacterium]
MDKDLDKQVRDWLAADPDADTRAELTDLLEKADAEALAERFSSRLAFGTAGLRGFLGAGPNRMNRLLVRQTSAGLADYLLANVSEACARGVVIAYDGRHKSDLFAQDTAGVLMAKGFRVFLFSDKQPTPMGAYHLLEQGAAAAVVVTASHNPPAYNGFKVYWENGAQIIPPHDVGIAQAIELAAQSEIDCQDMAAEQAQGLLAHLGREAEDAYKQAVLERALHPAGERAIRIAYTPLHGVGANLAEGLLQAAGFEVQTVASQREPDGDFPTVNFPNPEEDGAMDAVCALGKEMHADLVCA